MDVNIDRVLKDFEIIVSYTNTPEKGCTRFSYSAEDKRAREYLLTQMEQLGLSIKVDAIGNIRAKYGDKDKPSIMIGSHIDTVKNGGKYDGLTGVLVGLEVIRVLKEENVQLSHPVELIIFTEEEGSNFGITLLGSKVLTGKYELEDLKLIKNVDGKDLYEVAKDFGLEVENIKKDVLKKNEVDTMIELHIEQGAVLESKNKSIGIVQAIAGMKTYKVSLNGISNHAGTTPMELRADPMVGASHIISHIQKAANEMALPTTVATVGKIDCRPNMGNVIPESVEFLVDIRDVEPQGINFIANELRNKVEEISSKYSLSSEIKLVGESEVVKLSPKIIETIEQAAIEQGYSYMKMNSGAVHDAVMLTELADVGMIFIPSVGGKSHSPEEYTSIEDIKIGGNLLLNVVLSLTCKEDRINFV
ncbi:M20 family metallo-hydrolase [Bacillus sp. FJAT-29937]|uniref:M20 family metallo-hydrolase n=1 Tax=Bacillus sp. FJAT-29937 TaxID=1720553 RepID=UPI00083774DF|nr:M20 family metallo-hydrolase [Bacillus sp. FJAT-29937]